MTPPAPLPARRLLLVHAHPDDETLTTGATMARYAAEGAHVSLVTCTLGEEGEVIPPALAHLAADRDDVLGDYRAGELAAAMAALGVTDHRFLGGPGRYRDSGMMGLATNDRPGCFWRADLDEAAGHLVAVVRELRPQVLVTYDTNGGYGHPDHIQAHRVAMRAAKLAGDAGWRPDLGPAWTVPKIYWIAAPRSALAEELARTRAAVARLPGLVAADSVETLGPGTADALVTTAIDASGYLARKLAAMRAHASQIRQVDAPDPCYALSNRLARVASGVEHFRLVRGQVAAPPEGGLEDDLFAGIITPSG